MGEDKKTIMVLKVDLQCSCCYTKVKKVLCKFPQIRDQVYDEKANTVTITVICCSPEKLRDKICCKGGKAIKCIEIKKDSPKPKESEKPKGPEPKKPEEPEKPTEPLRPTSNGKSDKPPNPKPPPAVPFDTCCGQCYNGLGGGPCYQGQGFGRPVPPPAVPFDTCCGQCYNGLGGGPCYQGQGFGRPVPPPPGPCYDGYGYSGNRVSRCEYFSEENPAGCSIM